MSERVVVLTDSHGHADYLRAITRKYKDSVDRYVVNGDILACGEKPRETMELISQYDMTLNLGNHDVLFQAGVTIANPEQRSQLQYSCEKDFGRLALLRFAHSYRVEESDNKEIMIERIVEKMQKKSHWQRLADAALYFEHPRFIAIHAGLTDHSWDEQRRTLQEKSLTMKTGAFDEIPEQITSFKLANRQERFTATDKIVVTGHSHTPTGARVTDGGKRVRLASKPWLGEAMYVWQSWDETVTSILP
jgi:predicted phosphodiesterase